MSSSPSPTGTTPPRLSCSKLERSASESPPTIPTTTSSSSPLSPTEKTPSPARTTPPRLTCRKLKRSASESPPTIPTTTSSSSPPSPTEKARTHKRAKSQNALSSFSIQSNFSEKIASLKATRGKKPVKKIEAYSIYTTPWEDLPDWHVAPSGLTIGEIRARSAETQRISNMSCEERLAMLKASGYNYVHCGNVADLIEYKGSQEDVEWEEAL